MSTVYNDMSAAIVTNICFSLGHLAPAAGPRAHHK